MDALLKLFGTIFLIPIIIIPRGYVACKLWLWFVSPVVNLPPVSLAQAVGLLVFSAFLISGPSTEKADSSIVELSAKSLSFTLVTLGVGYFVHLFL